MSDVFLHYPASVMAGQERLSAADIVLLRKHVFPRGLSCPEDAQQLLGLHRAAVGKCPGWDTWFVETMVDYIVAHAWPQHSLDPLNAAWMAAMFAPGGVIETAAELELVLHAMERSVFVPDALTVLALDQLCIAIEEGRGAYAVGRSAKRTGLCRSDIDYLYRIFRGVLRDGRLCLSVGEIAALTQIDRAVCDRINHPAWDDLLRSVSLRDEAGYVPSVPWLQMQPSDEVLKRAA
jgi:hypothetical protein